MAMDDTDAGRVLRAEEMSAAQVFGSDVVMSLGVLNEARYWTMRRYFGVSRTQANLLTAVVVLAAAAAASPAVRHVVREPLGVSGADVTMGGLVVREVAYSIAGPGARNVPFIGALATAAVIGNLALP